MFGELLWRKLKALIEQKDFNLYINCFKREFETFRYSTLWYVNFIQYLGKLLKTIIQLIYF